MSDVTLTIDGIPVTVPKGTTILEAARKANVFIPTRIYFFFLFKLRQLPRIFKLEWRHLFFTLAATDTDREG